MWYGGVRFPLKMPSPQSAPSRTTAKRLSPEQEKWLRSHAGQWNLIEQAWNQALGGRLEAESEVFGLEPDDLSFPKGDPVELLRLFRKVNPGLDPLNPKDPYDLAVGVLRMMSPENPDAPA